MTSLFTCYGSSHTLSVCDSVTADIFDLLLGARIMMRDSIMSEDQVMLRIQLPRKHSSLFYRIYYYFVNNREQRQYFRLSRKLFHLKPVLSYLEVHLTDHCNMNCSGCSHYSPLADDILANVDEFRCDMQRLSQLFANVKTIRLLGGEPLLHPTVNAFLGIARTHFPKANVNVVTNGILLFGMPQVFWESCRLNRISINITLYPPLFDRESDFVEIAKNQGIKLSIVKSSSFLITTDSHGNSEREKVFKRCRKRLYCPILKQGRIYQCAKIAYVHYFNNAYSVDIPNTDFVDFHDNSITGWDVLSRIERSSETCRYCTEGYEKLPIHMWAKSRSDQVEWDIACPGQINADLSLN